MSVTTPNEPARMRADSPVLINATAAATVLMALLAWAAGVPGLLKVAAWAELDGPLRWTVPLILDGGLLVYGAVVTVQRARRESARFAWTVLALLTVASVAAQVAHVLLGVARPSGQQYVGAGVASTFPLLVFAATHSVLAVAVAPAPTRARRAAAARRPAPVLDAASTLTAAPAPRTLTPTPPRPVRPAPARAGAAGVEAREEALRLAGEGLSQRQIAATIGASKSSVARWLVAEAVTV